MLTRDLLRFQRRNGFRPSFIDPANPELVAFASELLSSYENAVHLQIRRAEQEELIEILLKGASEPKLAAGLNKLILDRCSFDPIRSVDYLAERRKLFTAAAAALPSSGGRLLTYRETLLRQEGIGSFLSSDIYGDLPGNEHLINWKPLRPIELLQRYNLALVQGLLIYAEELDVTAADSNQAELRRLFKYLRFFRLLAEIRHLKLEEQNTVGMKISGPFSLFENTRKYALQLAAFFPALVHLERWKLSAKIRLDERVGTLELDQSCGLVSHYRNFSNYVPEEIRMFHTLFKAHVTEWKIVGESPFLDGGGQEIVFPDLSFRREIDGCTIHLELFHRWHRAQLERRIDLLRRKPEMPLLIGIDRAIADDATWEFLLASEPILKDRMFRFRDFPGVERVHRALDSFSESVAKVKK